ncbi:cytochrome c oxidase subunit 6C [Cimex lectularius]|uniref:Mitochondrial cytochrome c oxidase subunit VIc/VIIs domain-containing protein n=1 Tax=Cimex lectularius TaxID=79782 RepID=A0A8I6RDQ5_CIMLE|nr:cytochrome c oxidase subunit 6C [Cimex lectularius]
MAELPAKKLPKPQLRGLLATSTRNHLTGAIVLSVVTTVMYKFLVCDARKNRYAEFYKNYDADAECDRLEKLGLLESCNPK